MPREEWFRDEIVRALNTWANSKLPMTAFVTRQEEFHESLNLKGKIPRSSLREWMEAALKDPDSFPGLDEEEVRAAHARSRKPSLEEWVSEVNAWAASGLNKAQFVKQRNGENPEWSYTAKSLSTWVNKALVNPSWFSRADWEKLQEAHERDRKRTPQERVDEINAWAASGFNQAEFVGRNPEKTYTAESLGKWVREVLENPNLFPRVDLERLKKAYTRFGQPAQVRASLGGSGSDLPQQGGSYLPEIAAAKIYGEYLQLRQDWPELPHGVRIAIRPEGADQSPDLGAIVVRLNPSGQTDGWPGTSQPPEFLADPGLDLDDPHVIAALSRAGVNDAMYTEAWYMHRDFRHAKFGLDPRGQPTAPTLYPSAFADRSGASTQPQAAYPTMPQGTGNLLTTGAATAHLPGPYPHHSHHQQQGAPSATQPARGHTSAARQRNVAK